MTELIIHKIWKTGAIKDNYYLTTKKYYEDIKKDQFFRAWGGFGISLEILNYLKEHNIDTIIIRHIAKTGTYFYKSSPEDFLNFGKAREYNSDYYKVYNDWQYILNIKIFIKLSEDEGQKLWKMI